MCRRTGGALRPDVDLLAPVRESTGQLSAEPGEATKVRTSHHRDGLLVGLRECEQLAGSRQHLVDQLRRDPMSGQIEKSDLMGDLPQGGA
ncbi:Uncharacterised protein [Mycobacteroides abscessus subsp. abscessus]|nr:Uncharacterised protein [Mycobacteroides abscessus subsp. abscessus]